MANATFGQTRTADGDRTWLPLSTADWDTVKDLDPSLPHPYYPKLDVARAKRMMREYLASIASVDRNVGRLLGELKRLGLARNTVVVFTSDHGYNLGHNGIWHKGNGRWLLTDRRGSRPNLYDQSLRVPALVRWPGVIQSGVEVDQTVTNLDWYPTLLAMVGVNAEKNPKTRGRNFLPLLMGKQIVWDNDLFAQYSMRHDVHADLRGYRTQSWKLVRDFLRENADELYDLETDPDETRNLIHSTGPGVGEKRRELDEKLTQFMREIDDPILTRAERE